MSTVVPDSPEEVEAAFEAAMASGNGSLASSLAEHHPDTVTAMRRSWNLLALGVDTDEPFSLEMMKRHQGNAADRAVEDVIERHGGKGDCDNPFVALNRLGGSLHDRDAPHMAFRLITERCLTPGAARDYAAWAWKKCEFPEANFQTEGWLLIFDWIEAMTGARLHDDDPDQDDESGPTATWSEPEGLFPTEPVTLWRGAIDERAVGMAWTADRSMAEWFVQRLNGGSHGEAHLWETTVSPDRVRARFIHRKEDEYVLNTIGMRIGAGEDGVHLAKRGSRP